jgi:hypothetical protein
MDQSIRYLHEIRAVLEVHAMHEDMSNNPFHFSTRCNLPANWIHAYKK